LSSSASFAPRDVFVHGTAEAPTEFEIVMMQMLNFVGHILARCIDVEKKTHGIYAALFSTRESVGMIIAARRTKTYPLCPTFKIAILNALHSLFSKFHRVCRRSEQVDQGSVLEL
jgi:hypothetical protein